METIAALANVQSCEDGKKGFADVVDVQHDAARLDALVDAIPVDALQHHPCIMVEQLKACIMPQMAPSQHA